MRKTRWIYSVLLVSIMVIAAGLTPPRSVSGAGQTLSTGCQTLNDPALDVRWLGITAIGLSFFAGEKVVMRATDDPSSHTIQLLIDGVVVDTSLFPGQVSYQFATDRTVTTIGWGVDAGTPLWDVSCYVPTPAPASVYQPGCDAFLALTPNAVVGRFVQDAPLYWAPDQLIDPMVTIPAGKTAWVLGQDASGAYYKIAWACDLLWVPVSSMGPNVGDPLWDGVPLPSNVIS